MNFGETEDKQDILNVAGRLGIYLTRDGRAKQSPDHTSIWNVSASIIRNILMTQLVRANSPGIFHRLYKSAPVKILSLRVKDNKQ